MSAERSRWGLSWLLIVTIGLASVVAVVALLALGALDGEHRQDVYAEFVKLGWQFVVIVLLGALLTLALGRIRDRREREDRKQQLRQAYIRRLIDCTHRVERASWLINANRSAKTWSEEMTGDLIPAFVDLRDIRHDLNTWAQAQDPVFFNSDIVERQVQDMAAYLKGLVLEFGEMKKELSKMQRAAERKDIDDDEWERRQDAVWQSLQGLDQLHDLLGVNGGGYGGFRATYVAALTNMRAALAGQGRGAGVAAPAAPADPKPPNG